MTIPPSGDQYQISFGEQRATIVEVGGGIREYEVGGRDVLDPYALADICDGAHGTPLVPWPNRLADGKYNFHGIDHQVAITEPSKNNAIHGFLRWYPWSVTRHQENRVTVSNRIFPQTGYPFTLNIEIDYVLNKGGLCVTTTASNLGNTVLPFGFGQHPYLSPGKGVIDDCTLELKAFTRVLTDNPRQLPSGSESSVGTAFDFSQPRLLGSQALDYPFKDIERDKDGKAWVKLYAPDGFCSNIWVDESYPYIEIYTGDTLSVDRRRKGLGTEPMTCAPNAFQSGEGLLEIDPGESKTMQWGALLTKTE